MSTVACHPCESVGCQADVPDGIIGCQVSGQERRKTERVEKIGKWLHILGTSYLNNFVN